MESKTKAPERVSTESGLRVDLEPFFRLPFALMAVVDFDGRFVELNAAWETMLGRPVEAMIDQPLAAFVHPNDVERTSGEIRELAMGRAAFVFENRFQHADGHFRILQWNAKADRDGGLIYGMATDVTDLRKAESDLTRSRMGTAEPLHALPTQQLVDREKSLEAQNRNLERRVAERTAELRASNEELEAFCFSVSHDLRAPLRSIDGFSKAVIEDSGDALPPEAQESLQRVRAASRRMSDLIDALLGLSRLTRAPLRREWVDLTCLAESKFADLGRDEPCREVDIRVQPGLRAHGDPRLLRSLIDNLVENAWKFTRKTPEARIEIGSDDQGVFVRDNGAGFDMAYVSRLFRPFERLHTESEFEGNGIGLATVQRIVTRHGGIVWAEGAVGKGATVRFTLGTSVTDPVGTA